MPPMIEALKPVKRWTNPRRLEVLWALRRGLVTIEQVCAAHRMSVEELASWSDRERRFGADGLKMKKGLRFRDPRPELVPAPAERRRERLGFRQRVRAAFGGLSGC